MSQFLRKLACKKGQGTVEYALVTLAIVIILGAVLFAKENPLKGAITSAFDKAATQITNTGNE